MKKLSLKKIKVAKLSNTQLKEVKGNGVGARSQHGGPLCQSGVCIARIDVMQ